MKKEACFVVLNYNDAEITIKLVDSLCRWGVMENKMQVIIVDNKSQDDSYKKLVNYYKCQEKVDVLLTEKNGGYSYGNNWGAKYAINTYAPKYIVIANPDIEIHQSTFERLLKTFDIDENLAMVAPIMQDTNGNYSVYAQQLPDYKEDLKACFNSQKSKTIIKNNFEYFNQDKNMIITQMLPGSFFVIRTHIFEQIGMFDENVFLFCEERILGRKLYDNGYKAVLRTDLFFVHAHSVSIKKAYDSVKTWKMLMKSRLYYEKEYNKISRIQEIILKLCMNFFVINLKLRASVYKLLKS